MAKRRSSKKGRGPKAQKNREPVRSLDLGPVAFIQDGPNLVVQPNPSHPDFEAFRREQRDSLRDLPQQVLELRHAIADVAAPYHAFDVLFQVLGTYGFARAGTLKPLADGMPTTAEFVAHILLDRASPEPLREATPEEQFNGVNAVELGNLVGQMASHLPMLFTHRQIGDDDLDPWTEIRSRLYIQRMTVRSFTFDLQETETLRYLFGDFDSDLTRNAGFTVEQALRLAKATTELPISTAADRAARARAFAKSTLQSAAARRSRREQDDGDSDPFIERLANLSPHDAERMAHGYATKWMGHDIGQEAAFTVESLAEHAEVDVAQAEKFVGLFAVEFSERSDHERWRADPERSIGGEVEVMRERPLLHDGEGRYLPCSTDGVFFALRDRLTDALKSEKKAWKRFQSHRARTLEERALKALAKALNADWFHGSVGYGYVDEHGNACEGEADGMLCADSVVVFVEAKAGALAPSARRSAPERLARGLRDLVEAAANQLHRNEAVLLSGKASTITDKAGNPLSLDTGGVLRCLPIAVTLEDLSSVAPGAWRLQEAGLLSPEQEVPWVVGIHELELICELVERPAQLVHYILRRRRSNRQRVWGSDEMDFFMRYLGSGLFWKDEDIDRAYVELHNHSDPLDAWWFGKHGLAKPAKKPRQRLNKASRQLLEDIEATGSTGRLEAQLMMLDMDKQARERIAGSLRTLLRKTAHDGQPHDMTHVFGENFAVTVHSVPAESRYAASERLTQHGQSRVARSNLRRWLGLAAIEGSQHRIGAMSIIVNPERVGVDEPDRTLRSESGRA